MVRRFTSFTYASFYENHRAALEADLFNIVAALKMEHNHHLHILHEREQLTSRKANLEVENRRLKNCNDNDRENYERLNGMVKASTRPWLVFRHTRILFQSSSKEETMADFRKELLSLKNRIESYSIQTTTKKEDILTLRREKKDRRKILFYSLVDYKGKLREVRNLKDDRYRMVN